MTTTTATTTTAVNYRSVALFLLKEAIVVAILTGIYLVAALLWASRTAIALGRKAAQWYAAHPEIEATIKKEISQVWYQAIAAIPAIPTLGKISLNRKIFPSRGSRLSDGSLWD